VAANFIGVRSCFQLTQRWLVVVPAGIVLVDPIVIIDALLVQKKNLADITYSPAPENPRENNADANVLDLTATAVGPYLTVSLRDQDVIVPAPKTRKRGEVLEPVDVQVFRCTPVRSGWFLDEVKARGFLNA